MSDISKEIEKQVLNKIVPNNKDRLRLENTIDKLKILVKKQIKNFNIPIEIELVGSTAKDTYLKNNLDIDLFICFPTSTSRETLENVGLFIGKKILEKQEECFAEHPYLRGEFNGYKTEIVPCYKIESVSQKISAVDRTPLHTEYIIKNIKEEQKNEVRLFKQFLYGIGCYGAEAEVEGFSGYLCEILILKYSSFEELILNASNWNYGQKLCLREEINPDFNTPLIFIDPVDRERNVSSALSDEKFNLFIKACVEYIKKPQITFFFPNDLKPWSMDRIKKEIKTSDFIGIRIVKPNIIPENLYPQVRKSIRAIVDLCKKNDFPIIDSFFYLTKDSINIIIHPEKHKISETKIHMGPPIKLKKNKEEFIDKWTKNSKTIKKPFQKNNRVYVEIKRDYVDINKLLKKEIRNLSLGKHIDPIVKENFIILDDNELLNDDFCMMWTKYLDKRMPWER